jgi:site-specific DNA recombinase
MRILGYVRLSRASREESTSIERQRELIATTCAARGFELIDVLEDVDVSATRSRLDRPGLHTLRRRIAANEADAVMVWRLDRLVRSVVDVGVLLDEGLQIVSATEALDTTSAMGRAMVEILQVFASMEAKTIGLRVSASQQYLRKVGRFPGGVVPYGYRSVPHPDGIGRALEPHPEEAATVRRMADEVLAGSSVYAVTTRLNEDGIPPRRSATWSTASVQRIIRSNAVLGRVKSNGALLREPSGVPVVAWTPLLPVEDVERIRQITDWTPTPGRSEATKAARGRVRYMLSGLLQCPGCNGVLVGKNRRSTSGRNIYACAAAARGQVCTGGVAVECDRVEAEVERHFLAAYGALNVLDAHETIREIAGLAAVEEAIRETTDELRDPSADLPALFERLSTLRAERERLDAVPQSPRVELRDTGETFSAAWRHWDVAARRRALVDSGVEISLAPARQRGRWDPDRVTVSFSQDYLRLEDLVA